MATYSGGSLTNEAPKVKRNIVINLSSMSTLTNNFTGSYGRVMKTNLGEGTWAITNINTPRKSPLEHSWMKVNR